uniref:Uncharacterized protein n=1 Tax=Timema tahoe TaxID=61484 RepID=A0A7R9FLM6_9NEOP|nr:unnamed protein product [Timema tahoe]
MCLVYNNNKNCGDGRLLKDFTLLLLDQEVTSDPRRKSVAAQRSVDLSFLFHQKWGVRNIKHESLKEARAFFIWTRVIDHIFSLDPIKEYMMDQIAKLLIYDVRRTNPKSPPPEFLLQTNLNKFNKTTFDLNFVLFVCKLFWNVFAKQLKIVDIKKTQYVHVIFVQDHYNTKLMWCKFYDLPLNDKKKLIKVALKDYPTLTIAVLFEQQNI